MKTKIRIAQKLKHFLPSSLVTAYHPIDVILVGVGGTGSQILTGLGRMNHALAKLGHAGLHLHVFDSDTVSPANVGRQIFSMTDVGRNKAETLVTRVNTFFGTNWVAYPNLFSRSITFFNVKQRSTPEIIITAVDSASARIEIAQLIADTGITYWCDAGNKSKSGQCVFGSVNKSGVKQPGQKAETTPVLPTVLDLYPDIKDYDDDDQTPSCSLEEALTRQDLFVNQWVATICLEILWKGFRKGFITEHGAFVDLNSLVVRPLPVNPETWKSMGWEPCMKKQQGELFRNKRKKAA